MYLCCRPPRPSAAPATGCLRGFGGGGVDSGLYVGGLSPRCQRRFKSDPVCDLIAGVNLTHPLPSQLLSWRLSSLWACHDAGPPFVLQPIALAGNLHDGGVMQDAVEHRCRQDGVAGEGLIPATERQIGSEDQGSLLVSLGYDLEE